MRKKVAIVFLLLANIVLLTHTVLPHHHHSDGSVCFFVNSCNNDVSHDNENHQNRCDDCSLISNVFINQQQGQDHIKYEPASHPVLFITPYDNINLRQNTSFSFEYIPFITSLYSSALLRTCGLRAPPAQPLSLRPELDSGSTRNLPT